MLRAAIYCILLPLVVACNKKYNVERPIMDVSTRRFDIDYSDKIASAEEFVTAFLRTYQDTTLKEIDYKFRDSFPYLNNNKIDITLNISTTREILIEVNDTTVPQFTVKATEYPIQVALINALDIFGKVASGPPELKKHLQMYDNDLSPVIAISGGPVTFSNIKVFNTEKSFRFTNDSVVAFLINVDLVSNLPGTGSTHTNLQGVNFLTPARDFYGFEGLAREYGRQFAKSNIQTMYFSSRYFRQTMAYDKLSPLAYEMHKKYFTDSLRGSQNYTLVDFNHDRETLEYKVASMGLDKKFAANILQDVRVRMKPGVLLWVYTDFLHFTIQWFIVGSMLLVLLIITYNIKRIRDWKIWKVLCKVYAPHLIIVGINSFIWTQRPAGIPLQILIIPGAMFIVEIVISLRFYPPQTKPTDGKVLKRPRSPISETD